MLNGKEENLFSAVRNGDEDAFEQLFKKYQPKLFVFCYGILNDDEAAKDAVQDSFIVFWENRETIQADFSVIAYLFKIAHSKCVRYLRKNSIKSNFSDLSELELREIELTYYNPEKNSSGSVCLQEIEGAYEKAIEKLPKQCQAVFVLSKQQELKNVEIARKLSLSLRTVENHLYRATRFVREEMKQYVSFVISLLAYIATKM